MDMTNHKLAYLGGEPIIKQKFKPNNSMGLEERDAALKVIETGILSSFIAAWGEDFSGGEQVKQFESEWSDYFKIKHAITVNSWTSGLFAMMGAIGVSPGDEVILPPWTMCASATSIVMWGGIPIFADIDPRYFCLDPMSVRSNITSKTKAILAVDIFGQSSPIKELREIADENNFWLLSDSAQAPGSLYHGTHTGTETDIGGFSLNYHKHIHNHMTLDRDLQG